MSPEEGEEGLKTLLGLCMAVFLLTLLDFCLMEGAAGRMRMVPRLLVSWGRCGRSSTQGCSCCLWSVVRSLLSPLWWQTWGVNTPLAQSLSWRTGCAQAAFAAASCLLLLSPLGGSCCGQGLLPTPSALVRGQKAFWRLWGQGGAGRRRPSGDFPWLGSS